MPVFVKETVAAVLAPSKLIPDVALAVNCPPVLMMVAGSWPIAPLLTLSEMLPVPLSIPLGPEGSVFATVIPFALAKAKLVLTVCPPKYVTTFKA